jgi:hypothetical protein
MMKHALTTKLAKAGLRTATVILILASVAAGSAHAFSLLGYRTTSNPLKWTNDIKPFLTNGLTYTIDSGFLSGSANARDAVTDAFQEWSTAGVGLGFMPSQGLSIAATDALIKQLGLKTALLNWQLSGTPVTVPIEGNSGLGANIDVFSKPSNFSIVVNSQTVAFGANTLALTVPVYQGTQLVSADIYLNQKWNWTTDGSGAGYDAQSVLTHEIGHALGLDHPDQSDNYSWPRKYNYDPVTYNVVDFNQQTPTVMRSNYTGVKRDVYLEDTGGLTFLYGNTQPSPPLKSLVLFNSFIFSGGTADFANATIVNDAGHLSLDPASSHHALCAAIQQAGVQDISSNTYFMSTPNSPAAELVDLVPRVSDMTVQFDLAFLSGSVVDTNAYFAFLINDIEAWRMNFAALPDAGLPWYSWNGPEGIVLHTYYYRVTLYFTDIPYDALNKVYTGKFILSEGSGTTPPGFALENPFQGGQPIPEPAAIFVTLAFGMAMAARIRKAVRGS